MINLKKAHKLQELLREAQHELKKPDNEVDAMTVTEAEARVVKQFEDSGVQLDYEVTGARESKIIQVID